VKEPPRNLLSIAGTWFVDAAGRKVILRGVNLGGDTKVPFSPDGATQNREDWPPRDLVNVSWIGRPFPREEAEEHFSRLRSWGLNCLRFLTTWEAVEHAGPYRYDEPYLDYLAEMIALAGRYGFHVFVDPHQDVWSRVTGGDGAPLWLFDKIGLDYTRFDAAGAALNMQHLWDPAPKRNRYKKMMWGENYKYFVSGTLWTLFFAGRDFAPNLCLRDEATGERLNVQDYLFAHYVGSLRQIARRIRDMPHVFGFDSLNEPHHGFIGHRAATRRLKMNPDNPAHEPPLPGLAWAPVDGMFAAAGHAFDLEEIGIRPSRQVLGVKRKVRVNPNKVSIWKEGAPDFWREHGVWDVGPDGRPVCPDDDYFRVADGREVDFSRDYLLPFAARVAEALREYNPAWMILVEDEPEKAFREGAAWPENTPPNMVNGFHWYDLVLNMLGRFLWPVTLDLTRGKPVWGIRGVQRMYERQIGGVLRMTEPVNGGNCPCLLGEFGIPMDMRNGRYFRDWKTHGDRAFDRHAKILDLMYNVLDEHLLSSTQWCYAASNVNGFGDNWNLEDFSVFSRDQQTADWREDLDSGARGLQGFCRPYARRTAGTPLVMRFRPRSGRFRFEYAPDPAIREPTEIFVPRVQYPRGYEVRCAGASWARADGGSLLHLTRPTADRVVVELRRKE